MARSSGGGSRSGGSHGGSSSRSSGGSRSGGGSSYSNGPTISKTPFHNSRTFRYYRHGTPYYIYSDRNLCEMKDLKPRWFLALFYIPFIIVIISMFSGAVAFPQKSFQEYNLQNIAIVDTADVFDSQEEEMLNVKLKEFCDTTGVATQIVTVDYDEWTDNGTLENYALARYHAQFNDENSWLIVYSEQDNGAGDWSWEGIQGDNIEKVMNVFVDKFTTQFQSQLVVNQIADPSNAFIKAFDKSIEIFNNQHFNIDIEQILPALGILAFILVHAYIMIFAGTRKKYSYGELEEVTNDVNKSNLTSGVNESDFVECACCNHKYNRVKHDSCPNCSAVN